jgi:hypothetical protein
LTRHSPCCYDRLAADSPLFKKTKTKRIKMEETRVSSNPREYNIVTVDGITDFRVVGGTAYEITNAQSVKVVETDTRPEVTLLGLFSTASVVFFIQMIVDGPFVMLGFILAIVAMATSIWAFSPTDTEVYVTRKDKVRFCVLKTRNYNLAKQAERDIEDFIRKDNGNA